MAHPIIKYRLTKAGRIPEYLCKDAGSFSGMYGVNTNKAGKIPKWTSPQETLYLGMACGDPDSDGLPDGLDGTVDSKDNLQTYLTSISGTWTVDSEGVTGIKTETTTGSQLSWDESTGNYGIGNTAPTAPGLTTTTTDKFSSSAPSGTVIVINAGYVTKVVTEVTTSSGVTTTTSDIAIVHPYTNITVTGTSDSVGVVTTNGPVDVGVTTTKTTTTTTAATHNDITENYTDSISSTDVDGTVTKTRIRTINELTKVRNPFDPAAAATDLWGKYETVNGL